MATRTVGAAHGCPARRSRTARRRRATFSAQTRPPAAASSPRVIDSPIPVPNDDLPRRASAVEALEEVIELAGIEPGPVVGHRRPAARRVRRAPCTTMSRSAGEYCAAFSSRCDSAADASRGSISTSRQRRHPRAGRAPRAHAARAPSAASTMSAGGDPLPVDADRGRVDARHVEDVLEQARQPVELGACAARACSRRSSAGRLAAQVLDGDPDRRQRRAQIVAQRRQQRRREIGLLPHELGRVALREELRALDRNRRRRRPRRRACRCRAPATAAASTPIGLVPCRSGTSDDLIVRRRRGCARRRRADARRIRACRAPSPAPCSASASSIDDLLLPPWYAPPVVAGQADRHARQLEPAGDVAGERIEARPPSRSSAARRGSDRTAASPRCAARWPRGRVPAPPPTDCWRSPRRSGTRTARPSSAGSAIVNVPTGGRKKKLSVSIATIDTTIATRRRARVAAPSTTSRNASATVVGLTSAAPQRSESRQRRDGAPREGRSASRVGLRRSMCSGNSAISHLRVRHRRSISYRFFTAFLRATGAITVEGQADMHTSFHFPAVRRRFAGTWVCPVGLPGARSCTNRRGG